MHRAIRACGGVTEMEGLVRCGASVDAVDERGRTALHAVAQSSAMAERAARDARPEKPGRAEGLAAMRQSGKLFTGEKTLDELAEIAAGRGKPDAPRPPPSE